jgi:hypothetical protein
MPKNDASGFRILIILIITFLCLGISFIQMSRGYSELGGLVVSVPLSFVVVLILFYLIYEIHKARKENQSVAKFLGMYMFFVLLSFTGNFNAFYTFFMKNELLKTEVEEKMSALHKLRADTELALYENKGIDKKVMDLMSQLKVQIESRNEPGCGPKCEVILKDIEAELGHKLTRIKETPSKKGLSEDARKGALDKLVADYRRLIIGTEETALLNSIDDDITTLQKDADLAVKNPEISALETITKIVNRYNAHAINAMKLAGDNFKGQLALDVENKELGKISETFKSAYRHLDHWGTWFSGFSAIMIDLFVPLFVLSITKAGDKRAFSFGRRGAERLS